MSAKVIAFINFKGGVGKTANAVNVGAALAQFHKKRVLVVDLDAQCNSSLWLLSKQDWRAHTEDLRKSVYQIFKDHITGTERFEFEKAVVRGVPRTADGFCYLANLDLLPAAVELIEIEDRISHRSAEPYFKYLSSTLKPAVKGYDYVLLDCPPNVYSVSRNAIFMADELVIPYIPDFLSLSGFQIFAGLVERFQETVSGYKTSKRRARISAIIVNRYQRGNVYDEGLGQLQMLIQQLKEQNLVDDRCAVLDPPIRSCVKVAASPDYHLPITVYAPSSIGAQDYFDLTNNFVRHFEAET